MFDAIFNLATASAALLDLLYVAGALGLAVLIIWALGWTNWTGSKFDLPTAMEKVHEDPRALAHVLHGIFLFCGLIGLGLILH